MALHSVIPIHSASVTVTEGSTIVNVTGGHNCGFVGSGSLIFIGDRPVADAVSGTNADVNGNSTITLRRAWAYPTTTARMTVANTYEGMVDVTHQLKTLVEQAQANSLKIFEFKGNWDLAGNNALPPAPTTGSVFYRLLTGGTINGTLYRAGEPIFYDHLTGQWRSFWQGLGEAAFRGVSIGLENDQTKLMRIGFGGVGASLDLRAAYADEFSTPQKCTGRGQIVGMMVGGPSGLNIPWLTDPSYGTLTINGSYGDFSAGTAITQSFNYAGNIYTRAAKDLFTWEPWGRLFFQGFAGVGTSAERGSLNEKKPNGFFREENPANAYAYTTTLNLNSDDGVQQLMIDRMGNGVKYRAKPDGYPWAPWVKLGDSPHAFPWIGVDFNTIQNEGWYRYLINAASSSNFPPTPSGGTHYWYLHVIRYNYGSQIQQFAYNYSGGAGFTYTYTRTYYNGFWSLWKQHGAPAFDESAQCQYDATNKTSSGAIIHTGSNVNGTYTLFADGTMQCITELVTPSHALSMDASASRPWPSVFSTLKAVVFSPNSGVGSGYQGNIGLALHNGVWAGNSNTVSAVLSTYSYRSAIDQNIIWYVVGYGTWR